MKKLFLTISLAFLLFGCSHVRNWTDYQAACAVDTACMADVKKYAEIGKQTAGAVNPAAGMAAGGVLTYLLMGVFGKKLKKKEEPK